MQGVDCVEIAGQFAFAEAGVDFAVTDLVQKDGLAALAAARPGHEVVQALMCPGRDRATAKRANRVGLVHFACSPNGCWPIA